MKNVIAYVRVSTDAQAMGDSLESKRRRSLSQATVIAMI